ncbi:MAG: hypothetical protein ACI4WS_01825 [Oscillospiraceae bacterium]
MKLRIGLDIDDVFFRTGDMEQEYSRQKMIDDGYTTDETGNIYRRGEMYAKAGSVEERILLARYEHIQPPERYYTDPAWIDRALVEAVVSCIAEHPDWEFVVITSRASADDIDIDDISRSQRKKLQRIRSDNIRLVNSVLPVSEFYFTAKKALKMVEQNIDILLDDGFWYIRDVRNTKGKIPIWRLIPGRDDVQIEQDHYDGVYALNDFVKLKPILVEIEAGIT